MYDFSPPSLCIGFGCIAQWLDNNNVRSVSLNISSTSTGTIHGYTILLTNFQTPVLSVCESVSGLFVHFILFF